MRLFRFLSFLFCYIVFVGAAACGNINSESHFFTNFELTNENSLCLDGNWKFRLEGFKENSSINNKQPVLISDINFEENSWHKVDVPHDLEKKYAEEINVNYRPRQKVMTGCLRRVFMVPESFENKRIMLKFTGVSRACDLWINSQYAGRHVGMYDSFSFDISEYLNKDENEIFLRFEYPLGSKEITFLGGQDVGHSRPGIGIWGSVYLIGVSEPAVQTALINSDCVANTITAQLQCEINNNGKHRIIYDILDAEGQTVPGTAGVYETNLIAGYQCVEIDLKTEKLQQWSVASPHLYYLRTSIVNGQSHGSSVKFRFGYHEYKVKGKYFYHNGRPFYPKAMLMWAGHTNRGRDEQKSRERSTAFVGRFKSDNLNIVRTAHSPPNPEFAEVCDEMGFLVYLEIGNCVHNMDYIDSVAQELKRLVIQYYNNPSVVMYSLGNEVWKTKFIEPQDVLYLAAKSVKPSLEICPVSGGHTWPGDPAGAYKHIDFFDIHNYSGHMDRPWNQHQQSIENMNLNTLKRYYGSVDKPLFMGETVGLSWPMPPANMRSKDPVTPQRYVFLNESGLAPVWTSQVGMWRYFWPVGMTGGPGEANYKINGKIVKLVCEQMRQIPEHVQGFCAWADNYAPETEKIIFSDILASCWQIKRHYFASDNVAWPVNINNCSSETFSDCSLVIQLQNTNSSTILQQIIPVPDIEPIKKEIINVHAAIPDNADTGIHKVYLIIKDKDDSIISKNSYDIFVIPKNKLFEKTKSLDNIIYILFDEGGHYQNIFKQMGIKYKLLSKNDLLPSKSTVIVSCNGKKLPQLTAVEDAKLLNLWLKEGGRLLYDRLGEDTTVNGLTGYRIIRGKAMPNAELVAPEYPAFRELTENTFFYWDNNKGDVVSSGVFPLTENVLLGKGFDQNNSMAAAAFKIGKGAIYVNQLYSAEEFENNSSAALYTIELLRYLANSENLDGTLPPAQIQHHFMAEQQIDPANVVMLNIEPAANQAFTDKVADDKKGGWTDQGNLDLRTIPAGVIESHNIPFRIPDDKGGQKDTVIVLYGSTRPYFPFISEEIPVGKKFSTLYFLHTAAWCNKQYVGGREIMSYSVRYEDGRSEIIPVVAFTDIGEWWNPSNLKNAAVAWSDQHPNIPEAKIGLYMMKWENPKPESMIMGISCRSERTSAVPIAVAITGITR